MLNQNEFIKKINELTEIAADQENVILTSQLYELFPEIKGNEESLKIIKDYLKEKKIGLDEKLSFEEVATDEEKNYLDYYLEDLKEIVHLTKGEREGYMLSAMRGDEDAKAKIINDTLSNVIDIAKLYAGQGVFLEDLIGEGNLALISVMDLIGSCENANEADGLISSQIMNAMQDLIAESMDESKQEEKMLKSVNKVADAAKSLYEDLKRKVTVEELSKESGISESAIKKALKLTANKIDEIETEEES
ncbi:MAG: hypothetical protein IK068_00995 [Lachnospiraceae bacterium]|nr:hypothetical protein [Lachnospiraceae bacterium]